MLLDATIDRPDAPIRSKSGSPPKEETVFNDALDELAEALKAKHTQIIDFGASHISRTEAKQAIQMVYSKLVYAIRTRPRAKKNIFETGHEREVSIMKDFLSKGTRQP